MLTHDQPKKLISRESDGASESREIILFPTALKTQAEHNNWNNTNSNGTELP